MPNTWDWDFDFTAPGFNSSGLLLHDAKRLFRLFRRRFGQRQKRLAKCMLPKKKLVKGRRSRERRPPLSEIVTDTPPIWQRDAGQPSRCAMVRPRHGGTPYLIEVTSGPGKYTNAHTRKSPSLKPAHSIYGACTIIDDSF